MHSIAAVRSSSGAADYFANDNYYTAEENAEAGVWAGEGARDLGLAGPVERDAFEAILNGHLPDGDKVGQVEGRRLGLDLTFSMPKSASILALVGVVNLPIIKFSVDWWNTLHQPASIIRMDGPHLAPAMLWPLLTMVLVYHLYFVTVLILRMRAQLTERRIQNLRLSAAA